MIPGTLSIHPVPFPGPDDPSERVAELCDAIRRFAPFEPEVVLVFPGAPAAGLDPAEARRITVEGFRQAAKVAAEHGSRSDWSRSTVTSTARGRRSTRSRRRST